MNLLAVDPGPEASAFVDYRNGRLHAFGKLANIELLARLWRVREPGDPEQLVVEMIASYGMPVGREVFETCVWIGRFVEAWGERHALIYRKDVRMHLCDNRRKAKDAHVRQALIDRFGPGKARALGTIKAKGPLYGVSHDVWAALAVAVVWSDNHRCAAEPREGTAA